MLPLTKFFPRSEKSLCICYLEPFWKIILPLLCHCCWWAHLSLSPPRGWVYRMTSFRLLFGVQTLWRPGLSPRCWGASGRPFSGTWPTIPPLHSFWHCWFGSQGFSWLLSKKFQRLNLWLEYFTLFRSLFSSSLLLFDRGITKGNILSYFISLFPHTFLSQAMEFLLLLNTQSSS